MVVVDSFSRDRTVELGRAAGARLVQHRFTGFGDQRNWALENAAPKHPWVLILDADERVPSEMAEELRATLRTVPGGRGGIPSGAALLLLGPLAAYSAAFIRPTWCALCAWDTFAT